MVQLVNLTLQGILYILVNKEQDRGLDRVQVARDTNLISA